MMNILCIGDVVGEAGRDLLRDLIPVLQQEHAVDLTIVNAENAAGGSGITPRIADQLFRYGCDVLTMGDHIWDRQDILEYMENKPGILRPANFPQGTPGRGWGLFSTKSGRQIAVINLLGRVFMRYQVDCPFRALDRVMSEIEQQTKFAVVDLHAETTSEKNAMGFFADGRVSAVVGTHTHIQTADDKILPKGTAYITDLGMTGPYDSVIGQNKEKIIKRFLTSMPMRFEVAKGDPWLCGALISVDDETGLASGIQRVQRQGKE